MAIDESHLKTHKKNSRGNTKESLDADWAHDNDGFEVRTHEREYALLYRRYRVAIPWCRSYNPLSPFSIYSDKILASLKEKKSCMIDCFQKKTLVI